MILLKHTFSHSAQKPLLIYQFTQSKSCTPLRPSVSLTALPLHSALAVFPPHHQGSTTGMLLPQDLCLRCFLFRSVLPPRYQHVSSFTSSRSLLRCHLFRKALHGHLISAAASAFQYFCSRYTAHFPVLSSSILNILPTFLACCLCSLVEYKHDADKHTEDSDLCL